MDREPPGMSNIRKVNIIITCRISAQNHQNVWIQVECILHPGVRLIVEYRSQLLLEILITGRASIVIV